jgi:3-oxoacyl-(acyl-carrier-protein) synthase
VSQVLGIGIVTPLGDDPRAVVERVVAGHTALAPQPHLAALPYPRAAVVDGPDLGGWLTRKKDARLLARAARLALPAAGRALRALPSGQAEHTAIYVAVGREPPDDPDAEPSLLAMERDGRLDLALLGGRGRELYPPLLPLRTLPNMVLAHICIQHGLRGENGSFAGEADAGLQALRAACLAVDEGRAPFALAGASFSATDLASARDRLRLLPDPAAASTLAPPGEAAVFVLIGPGDGRVVAQARANGLWAAAMGDCGPVAGLWGLLG